MLMPKKPRDQIGSIKTNGELAFRRIKVSHWWLFAWVNIPVNSIHVPLNWFRRHFSSWRNDQNLWATQSHSWLSLYPTFSNSMVYIDVPPPRWLMPLHRPQERLPADTFLRLALQGPAGVATELGIDGGWWGWCGWAIPHVFCCPQTVTCNLWMVNQVAQVSRELVMIRPPIRWMMGYIKDQNVSWVCPKVGGGMGCAPRYGQKPINNWEFDDKPWDLGGPIFQFGGSHLSDC